MTRDTPGSAPDPDRFERLPATAAERTVPERVSRAAVVAYFADRFGIPEETWRGYTFWEKGAGKVWAYADELSGPVDVEALGTTLLRTDGRHWKPTTDGVQRFGGRAVRNVIVLDEPAAERFLAGADQPASWDGDWGYLIVAHELAGVPEPIGVGRFVDGELASMVPTGRRREW